MKKLMNLTFVLLMLSLTMPAHAQQLLSSPPEVVCIGGPFRDGLFIKFVEETIWGWKSKMNSAGLRISVGRRLPVAGDTSSAKIIFEYLREDGELLRTESATSPSVMVKGQIVHCFAN